MNTSIDKDCDKSDSSNQIYMNIKLYELYNSCQKNSTDSGLTVMMQLIMANRDVCRITCMVFAVVVMQGSYNIEIISFQYLYFMI